MLRFAVVIAGLVALGAAVAHADQLVLSGLPQIKIESSAKSTSRTVLSPAQAEEYGAVIVKRGDRYFWASRENRELHYQPSGIYHYFIDPQGGGYVKVQNSSDGGPVGYYEHVNLGLATITYWGTSKGFSP